MLTIDTSVFDLHENDLTMHDDTTAIVAFYILL